MLSYATVVLAASLVLGQADQRGQTDDFKKLRGFLGTWEATDVEFEGAKINVLDSWKPVLGGRFIEHKYMVTGEDDDANLQGIIMFGRDPADKNVRGWGLDNKGGVMAMELIGWDGTKSNWSTSFTDADGKTEKYEANSFEILDKNSYGWMLAIVGGETTEAVFKRVRPKKMKWPKRQHEAPDGLNEQLSDIAWWAGNYSYSGSDAFTKRATTGYSTSGWVLDGQFLLYDIASLDTDLKLNRYRAVIGVDPTTGKTTGWEFDSTGIVGKYTISNRGRDISGKAMSPDAGLLEYKGEMTKNADGIQYAASGDLPSENKTTYSGIWKRLE